MSTANVRGSNFAKGLFTAFAYVADCARRIEPEDIEQLNHAMDHVGSSKLMRTGIECLRDRYSALWADYEAGRLEVSLDTLRLCLAVTTTGMKVEQRQMFRDELLDFIRRAIPVQAAGKAGQAERRQARKEVERLFAAVGESEPPGPMQGQPAARQAVSIASAPAPALAPSGHGPEAAQSHATATSSKAASAGTPWPLEGPAWKAAMPWTSGEIKVVCVRVDEETHDVKTYTFAALDARTFHYRPGQFATLKLNIDGALLRRSYTLSSSPSRPHTLSITVKRVPGGRVSNWLYEHMKPGVELQLNGPHGGFTCFNHPAPKLLLISGGSGVTPMMSMLRWFADTATAVDIAFLNNVRTPADLIFEQELIYLSTRLGAKLRLVVVPSAHAPSRPWIGPMGRLDKSLLQALVPDFLERETFVCGPGPYMEMVRSILVGLQYPMDRFHQESFGGAPAPNAAAAAPARAPHKPIEATVPRPPAVPASTGTGERGPGAPQIKGASIVFQRSQRTIESRPDETLLEAAERCGIELEHSCRSGRCGACKLRKAAGEAQMEGQEALTEFDIQNGYLLACVAKATGPLTLEA